MTGALPAPEFSRMVDLRQITEAPLTIRATPEECRALARRFGLVSVGQLDATVSLIADGAVVNATGRMNAAWVQACAVSAEDLPMTAQVALAFRFVPETQAHAPDEEVELSDAELDEIGYAGTSFDLGEAVAQSMALEIDPFATGPEAARARAAAGIIDETASGAFAALAGLKLDKKD